MHYFRYLKKIYVPFLFKNVNIKYELRVCTGYPVPVCKPEMLSVALAYTDHGAFCIF